jgi:hypothetical protein
MSEYRIGWTTETWHEKVVEAKSLEDARNKFWEDVDLWNLPSTITQSGLLQDSVDVEEVL